MELWDEAGLVECTSWGPADDSLIAAAGVAELMVHLAASAHWGGLAPIGTCCRYGRQQRPVASDSCLLCKRAVQLAEVLHAHAAGLATWRGATVALPSAAAGRVLALVGLALLCCHRWIGLVAHLKSSGCSIYTWQVCASHPPSGTGRARLHSSPAAVAASLSG